MNEDLRHQAQIFIHSKHQNCTKSRKDLKNAKKNAPEHKKNSYSVTLYSTVLVKIVEVIGESTSFLKDHTKFNYEKKIHESRVLQLNMFYDKYLVKYSRTPIDMTIRKLIENEIYLQIPLFQSRGILTPEEIKQKKMLAVAGYSMLNEMKKWLEHSVTIHNQSFSLIIKNAIDEFVKWADSHPRAASYLISDIALTCSILLEKNAADKIIISINAMVFTKLFLDALGLCPEQETIENKKMLKFRVLADFINYCPTLATVYTITKKTANNEYHSFLGWALGAIKEASVTLAAQKITRLIPQGQEKLVSLVVEIIRGRDIQKIIAHRRNLALIELAGCIKTFIKNPYAFIIHFEVWFGTVFEANEDEIAYRIITQLILPAFAIAILTAAIFAMIHVYIAGIISILSFGLAIFLTESIDAQDGYQTKDRVLQKIKNRDVKIELLRASYFISTNKEKIEEIRNEAKIYITELQQKYALPLIPSNFKEKRTALGKNENDLIKQLKGKYLNELKMKYSLSNSVPDAPEVITLFNDVVDLKKIRAKLNVKEDASNDVIVFSLAEDLISEWLQPHVEQSFRTKFLKLYYVKKEQYVQEHSKEDVPIDDYLKTKIKRELKLSPDNYDKKNKKFILNSLRTRNVIQEA
jgi:hypothetical protein